MTFEEVLIYDVLHICSALSMTDS